MHVESGELLLVRLFDKAAISISRAPHQLRNDAFLHVLWHSWRPMELLFAVFRMLMNRDVFERDMTTDE